MTTHDVEKYLEALEAKGRDEGLRKGRDEGLKEGRDEGLRKGLKAAHDALVKSILAVYRARFGEPSSALVGALDKASDLTTLEGWAPIVATRSPDEIAAALIKPERTRAPRRVKATPRVAPRRAAASR